MKRLVVGIAAASFAVLALPHAAAAQCEGGVTVGGFYARDGSYVPGHCAYTNPTTPGQLYPSGAQPTTSTDPAQGASRLPGQRAASGLLPVNSSDLGPAPSYTNTSPLSSGGVTTLGPSVGPGAPTNADAAGAAGLNTGSAPAMTTNVAATGLLPGQASVNGPTGSTVGLPDQFPQTGLPALNGNRAVPSSLATVPLGTGSALDQINPAYGTSLGAAPARVDPVPTTAQPDPTDSVSVAFPNE
jgi:hypothetical protein